MPSAGETSSLSDDNQQKIVFISYSDRDIQHAEKLYEILNVVGLQPWMKTKSLLIGQDKNTEIRKAIKNSRYFIALLSKNTAHRDNVHTEFNFALEVLGEFPEGEVFILPIRLDNCEIPYEKLRHKQYADLFPNWKAEIEMVLKSLNIEKEKIMDVLENPSFQESSILPTSTETVLESQAVSTSSLLLPQLFKGEKAYFVGRQKYLDEIIKDKLTATPSSKVCIFGPGGSGKSQLAFKAMHQYIKEGLFDLVIPLYFDTGIVPLEKILSEMAGKMGLKIDDFEKYGNIDQRKSILTNILRQKKHPLIYLDNYETVSYVINGSATSDTSQKEQKESEKESKQAADDLNDFLNNNISSINNTSILLTSRQRNNYLVNEESIDLEGLDIDDSIKLFNAFVRYPQFKNPKIVEVRDKIQKLLKKTGGHPLSVEIIAKNVRTMRELDDLSELLGPLISNLGERTERFKTLEACFGYTVKRLDKKLQQLLPKLILFKSPFPISAAVKIFDSEENDIIDLYDRSLLTLIQSDEIYGNIDDSDYWLYSFHPAVRNYLEAKISTVNNKDMFRSDLDDYSERFFDYYYNFLSNTYNSIGKENHRSAFARFNIIYQGDNNDFDRAAELTRDRQQSAYILSDLGSMVYELGILSKALEYHKQALGIHEEVNDKAGIAKDYRNIGIILRKIGKFDEALDYHTKALEIHTSLNDRVGMADDYRNIGNVFRKKEIFDEALDYHTKALEIHESLNDKAGIAKDYKNLGLVHVNIGNNNEALDYHNKALDITSLNDRVGLAKDYTNIGNVLRNMGNYQEALDYHTKALEIRTSLNDRVGMTIDYTNIGNVLSDMGNYQEAVDYHTRALEIDTSLNDRVGLAIVYSNIGVVLYNMGNYQEALDYYNKALEIDTSLNDRVGMARDLYNMNFVYVDSNKSQDALNCLYKALGILEEFKKETNYHHALIDDVNKQISHLKQQ